MKVYDILQPWQKDFVQLCKNNKRVIGMVARQSGKSFACAYLAVESAVLEAQTWICISTAERQAAELLKKCLNMTAVLQKFLQGTELSFSYSANATEITFSNGARIISVPNSPDTVRGLTGNIIADEVAFWPQDRDMWAAIVPFLTSQYGGEKKIVIISTPGAKMGLFYDIWEGACNKTNEFVPFKRDIFSVGKTLEQIADLRANCIEEEIFDQEYMLDFKDGNSALFDYDLLKENAELFETYKAKITSNLKPSKPTIYIGVDIGRTSDRTAIAIIEKYSSENVVLLHDVIALQNTKFAEQRQKIESVINEFKPNRLCIDSTGIGMQLAEELKTKFPNIVQPITFTNTVKNEMFGDLKKDISLSHFIINNNPNIISDLHQIRKVVSKAGNITYVASRDKSGHADIATSIALANYALKQDYDAFVPFGF